MTGMNKFILIGIPNCGKSTLGRRAADVMQLPFFDTDALVVDMVKLNHPAELFRISHNGTFLRAQEKVMEELAKFANPAIIATGAEAALQPESSALMKTMGIVIHIKRKPGILLEDLKKNPQGLILCEENTGLELNMLEMAIKTYMEESHQYEELADLTLENDGSEEEGLEKLVDIIKSHAIG